MTEAQWTIRKGSVLEEAFDKMLDIYGCRHWELDFHREYRFTQKRRFRFDFAWSIPRIAVEIDGATWAGGRHNRGAGHENDCRKRNLAQKMGWRVFTYTREMIASGEAIRDLQELLKSGPK